MVRHCLIMIIRNSDAWEKLFGMRITSSGLMGEAHGGGGLGGGGEGVVPSKLLMGGDGR